MATLETLKHSAKASALNRGHDMMRFHRDAYWTKTHLSACRRCEMTMYVLENPMANETNIFGPAVAQDCDGKGGRP